jgi:hypothetical protein
MQLDRQSDDCRQVECESSRVESQVEACHTFFCSSSRGGRLRLLGAHYLLTRLWYITSSPQSTSFRIYWTLRLFGCASASWPISRSLEALVALNDAFSVHKLWFLTPVTASYSCLAGKDTSLPEVYIVMFARSKPLAPVRRQNTFLSKSFLLSHLSISWAYSLKRQCFWPVFGRFLVRISAGKYAFLSTSSFYSGPPDILV